MNYDKRDELLFNASYDPEKYRGGIRYFDHLGLRAFRSLIGYRIFKIYPYTKYAEFWWFMENFGTDGKLFLNGFAYAKDRTDAHGDVVIESIERKEKFDNTEAEKVFKYLFQDADEFSLDPPYAFYD